MVMETLKESFKPEFLNRVDEIVIYHALPLEQIKRIVDIQIRALGSGWRGGTSSWRSATRPANTSPAKGMIRPTAPGPSKGPSSGASRTLWRS